MFRSSKKKTWPRVVNCFFKHDTKATIYGFGWRATALFFDDTFLFGLLLFYPGCQQDSLAYTTWLLFMYYFFLGKGGQLDV